MTPNVTDSDVPESGFGDKGANYWHEEFNRIAHQFRLAVDPDDKHKLNPEGTANLARQLRIASELQNYAEIISDDELLAELLNRFDHAAFVGVKESRKLVTKRRWKGNSYTVAGMCDDIAFEALDDYRKRSSDVGEQGI